MQRPTPSPHHDPVRQARVCVCGDHGFVGLTRGLVAVFDTADLPVVSEHVWHAKRGKRTFYAATRLHNQEVAMHWRLAGSSSSPCIDHRSGDGLNNRRDNLRACSLQQNSANRRKLKNTASAFKGVKVNKRTGAPFGAQIKVQGRKLWLGSFASEEAAALAYDRAAIKHFGDFARTNRDLGLLQQAAE